MVIWVLAACNSVPKDKVVPIGSTGVNMPPLSTDLQTPCTTVKDRKGDSVYASRARHITYGQCERRKHMDTVNAYNKVRDARPKEK